MATGEWHLLQEDGQILPASFEAYQQANRAWQRVHFPATFSEAEDGAGAWPIANTQVGPSNIDTVFYGLTTFQEGGQNEVGMDIDAQGRPIHFETMVFDGPLAGEIERYATLADALAGHEALVARVKSALEKRASDA